MNDIDDFANLLEYKDGGDNHHRRTAGGCDVEQNGCDDSEYV
jgi:hypothetical protein